MTQRPWTPAEAAVLEQLHDNGASNSEMCQTLNRSRHSIASKLRSLGREMGSDRFVGPPCEKHLHHIAEASPGYGFHVVTEPLLGRLFALEAYPAQVREFWRAA